MSTISLVPAEDLVSIPSRMYGNVKGPRLLYNDDGTLYERLIWHEDKKERAALERLTTRCLRQIDRIGRLCGAISATGHDNPDAVGNTSISMHIIGPSERRVEQLKAPWRPGQKRHAVALSGDRIEMIGGISSHIPYSWQTSQENLGLSAADTVLAHIDEAIAALKVYRDRIKKDLADHPEEYAPLPTLGEFMEREKATGGSKKRAG